MSNSKIENNYHDLIQNIDLHSAVLFLGSGFSSSAIALNNKKMPTGRALAQKIGEIGNFDAEGNLTHAATYFLKKIGTDEELISILKENLIVKKVQEHHRIIAKIPWRITYTTNYDDCFELAAREEGIYIKSLELGSKITQEIIKNPVCVHINGTLTNLTPETLGNEFKLTYSSYLSPVSLTNNEDWYKNFKLNLEYCSAIIFIGYSMYDIEIPKILFEHPANRNKTFIIENEETLTDISRSYLEDLGTIIPIGVENFAKELQKNPSLPNKNKKEDLYLTCIQEYELSSPISEIRDNDVESFLMYGHISDSLIEAALTGTKGSPLLITQERYLSDAKKLIETGKNLVITSEFGNGKSIFLKILRTHLKLNGYRIFTIDHYEHHQYEDLNKLIRSGIEGLIIIDDYEQNLDFIYQFAKYTPKNLRLIITSRTNSHEHFRSILIEKNLSFLELSIDNLNKDEVKQIKNIIDNIGLITKKDSFYLEENTNQLSTILLKTLSSPHIIDRIRKLIENLLSNDEYKITVFIIAILSIINTKINASTVSDLAKNDSIYSINLRNDDGFKQLFTNRSEKKSEIAAKSSIFSRVLLKELFPANYTIDKLLEISQIVDQSYKEIRSELLRFHVIERLLPDNQQKQKNLTRYYELVKTKLTWLNQDPHFWMQYAMTYMMNQETTDNKSRLVTDYTKAQSYLDKSYNCASHKLSYKTDYIDTQQARLYLLKSQQTDNYNNSFLLFQKAHNLLLRVPNNIYKLNQLNLYYEIYKNIYNYFSTPNQSIFVRYCKRTLSDLQNKNIQSIDSKGYGQEFYIYEQKKSIIVKKLKEILMHNQTNKDANK